MGVIQLAWLLEPGFERYPDRRVTCEPMGAAANIDRRLDMLSTDETSDLAAIGVFGPNKSAPLHRWVSFTEGFSAQLVVSELATTSPDSLVLDPFGGTGTTPLVAAQLGFRSVWTEVNPYLREAAETKIAAACASPNLRRTVVRCLREAALAGPKLPEVDFANPLLAANRKRDYFTSDAARELVGWIERFNDVDNELARRIGRLAVASSAISTSNMKRAVDLRRRTERELLRARPTVLQTVRERVSDFIEDLETSSIAPGHASWIGADARSVGDDTRDVDLIVTSPPYLNGTNYCRNTKLELLLLGLIDSEEGLSQLRTRSLTAGINNVSRRIGEPTTLDFVEPVAAALDQVAYDSRIPTMVRAYFSDMHRVFAELLGVTRAGGRLALDIGDSRFAGVHVDTPTLLTETAESAGWIHSGETMLRDRISKDGSPLCQKLIYFKRP